MDVNSLSHTKWNCKYHIVFAPKFRRKIVYVEIKKHVKTPAARLGGLNDPDMMEENIASGKDTEESPH